MTSKKLSRALSMKKNLMNNFSALMKIKNQKKKKYLFLWILKSRFKMSNLGNVIL